jgi:hypothetical protein
MSVMTATPRNTGRRHFEHVCTVCGKPTPRDNLVVKRVEFVTMGRNFKRLKVRSVAWLCQDCLKLDPHYQQEKHSSSPSRTQEIEFLRKRDENG